MKILFLKTLMCIHMEQNCIIEFKNEVLKRSFDAPSNEISLLYQAFSNCQSELVRKKFEGACIKYQNMGKTYGRQNELSWELFENKVDEVCWKVMERKTIHSSEREKIPQGACRSYLDLIL